MYSMYCYFSFIVDTNPLVQTLQSVERISSQRNFLKRSIVAYIDSTIRIKYISRHPCRDEFNLDPSLYTGQLQYRPIAK